VIGAIDPSLFIDTDGVPYLVYKTDGIPSSIRILQLTGDGLHPADEAVSQTLVTSTGVLENPVLLHRGSLYYLFNSYGDYARCSYATVWRASASLLDWSTSVSQPLLTRKSTHKLCGPGGADVIDSPTSVLMYFEAWTCKNTYKPCHRTFWAYNSRDARQHPKRALYAVKLGFAAGAPYVKKYLKGSKH
jgi:beta-xylosidase